MTEKGKILVVDDTPASLRLLTDLLKTEGYAVRAAISGELALNSATSNPPNLILLDIRMPDMDGFEVCRRLKAQPATRDIPVIFVSAASETDEKVAGFRVGAVDYLTKPYQREELLARVCTHLELNQLRNHLERLVADRTAELNENEGRLRAVVDSAPDAIILSNDLGIVIDWNEGAQRLFGFTKDEMLGQAVSRIIPQRFQAQHESSLALLHNGAQPHLLGQLLELEGLRKEGGEVPIELVLGAWDAPSGRHFSAVIRDVSKRKRSEAELQRINADLQRFAEVTAHHLQESARRIVTYADLLTKQLNGKIEDAETQLSLHFIDSQSRRLQTMLSDVESYLSADQPKGEIVSVNITNLLTTLLINLDERLIAAHATVNLGLLPEVLLDKSRLSEMFRIVLDNALKHANSPSQLNISISGERSGNFVHYRISDNGVGIEVQYRDRVFQLFERISSAFPGSGIGLSILRRIVENAGGKAWIEETPGGGCSVEIDLPAG